ncbi:TPA: hypothetical protein NHI63_002565 [Legionella pneumophila]|uniref:WGR domain-containing protein n=2 Tax=Legionella TaxID=445 RepID=A0A378PHT8_9GAMM|nr:MULTISPECIES: hypothetical protein [Legionella]KTD70523.1 hypothetical protein Lstg_3008 [Legionella steigerwaltii]MCZ4692037.1 hypothetical protein [Legionella pneumophila]MCZ4709382.1 hypothetical protein [Legionella pneumophila]MCZ4720994.1 hypothetical protein [Legionella pneumophila]WBA07493.1 hypothetical protein LpnH3D14_03328 [Legionella pneumophila]
MSPWFINQPFLRLIDCSPRECYHAARFEKGSRYYVIRLSKDLLEDWVITLINGRIKSRLGQSRTLAFASFSEGFDHFCTLVKIRNLRGYQLKTITCDNHLLLHLLPFVGLIEDKHKIPSAKTINRINQREHLDAIPISLLPQADLEQLGFAF